MSDDRIYVRFKGKTLGPLTSSKVQELVKRGQITRMHELSSDGMSWMRAEEFGNVFQSQRNAASQSSVPAGEPAVGIATAPIASPPVSAPRVGEAPEPKVEWYAHLEGENRGPINSSKFMQMIDSGHVGVDTLVWRAGFEDWQPAGDSFPEKFGRGETQSPTGSGLHSLTSRSIETNGPMGLAANFAHTQTSIRFLAISTLVLSGLAVLYFITVMLAGSEADWAIGQGALSVVYGLAGLVMTGVLIAGAILLLRYASSLRMVLQRPESALVEASKRLRTFWQYCAVVVLVLEIVLLGGAVLLLVMLIAVADSAT